MIGCSDSSYGPAAVIFSPRAPAFIAGALNDRNPLHSSHFNFDERVLLTGVETFKRILECESKCTKKK